MSKKQSNPSPPELSARPKPPPGPPCRTFRSGLFGYRETKESIRALQEYKIYMQGWRDGFHSRVK